MVYLINQLKKYFHKQEINIEKLKKNKYICQTVSVFAVSYFVFGSAIVVLMKCNKILADKFRYRSFTH